MSNSTRLPSELMQLHEFLVEFFSLSELRDLCFKLDVEYENLSGIETRKAKSRELLLYLGRKRQFDDLWELLPQMRPKAKFSDDFGKKEAYLEKLYSNLEPFATRHKPISERLLERIAFVQVVGILLILLIVIVSGITLYQTRREPKRMSGDFRIAVTGFAEQPVPSDTNIGSELAENVFLHLQKNIDEANLDFIIVVWGPEDVGVIQGVDETERAVAAAQLAEEIGADLIVYGIIDHSEATWQILPEFYVATTEFYEAEDITGPHKLGSPLSFIKQGNRAEQIETSQDLTERTQILTQIAIGLAYYAIFDYDQAYETFSSLTELDAWEELEGQEVVYLLTGNAAIKSENLELAEEHYQASLDLDSSYSRGFLGIAGVHYLRAMEPAIAENDYSKIDMAELELAITNFKLAASASKQPLLANITEKVHFGLGQAYLAQAFAGDERMLNQAGVEFSAVIAAYGTGENQTLRQLAAESHGRLGLMYLFSDNNEKALEAYETAVTLLYDNPERQTIYQERVDDLKADLDDTES